MGNAFTRRPGGSDAPFAQAAPPVASGSPYFLTEEQPPTPLLPTADSRDATSALYRHLFEPPLERPVPYPTLAQSRRDAGLTPPPGHLLPGTAQPPWVGPLPGAMEAGGGPSPPALLTEPHGIPGGIEFNGTDVIAGKFRGGAAGLGNPAKAAPLPPQPVGPSGPIVDQAATEEAARERKKHRGPVDLAVEALRRENQRP